jgi:hypothetical protein
LGDCPLRGKSDQCECEARAFHWGLRHGKDVRINTGFLVTDYRVIQLEVQRKIALFEAQAG